LLVAIKLLEVVKETRILGPECFSEVGVMALKPVTHRFLTEMAKWRVAKIMDETSDLYEVSNGQPVLWL